jgi:perosamine synthetase
MISILCETPMLRDDLREYLREDGIETRPTFYPVHTMPMFSQKYLKLPAAEILGHNGINLPSYPDLTDDDLDYICGAIRKFFIESTKK